MKKAGSKAFITFIGILLFFISIYLDNPVNLFFKSLNFHIFDFILIIVTNFAFVGFVMLLVPSLIFYKDAKKLRLFWIAFVSSAVLSFALKLTVLRHRPTEMLSYPFIGGFDYSFPSMHTMIMFASLPLLVKFLPKQKNLWILFAFLIAFTRVYFGFHFLSDVVFGGFFGYIMGNFILDLHESGKL